MCRRRRPSKHASVTCHTVWFRRRWQYTHKHNKTHKSVCSFTTITINTCKRNLSHTVVSSTTHIKTCKRNMSHGAVSSTTTTKTLKRSKYHKQNVDNSKNIYNKHATWCCYVDAAIKAHKRNKSHEGVVHPRQP